MNIEKTKNKKGERVQMHLFNAKTKSPEINALNIFDCIYLRKRRKDRFLYRRRK